MDKILIEGIQLACVVGTGDWERQLRQKLSLDLILELDLSAAGKSDQLEETVNYVDIVDSITGLVEDSQYVLIEALAEAIAGQVVDKFPVNAVSVTLNKGPAIKGAKNVAVSIRRAAAA